MTEISNRESTDEIRMRLLNDPEVKELISLRAYEIYLGRNGEIGSEIDDWLRAENEILAVMLREELQESAVLVVDAGEPVEERLIVVEEVPEPEPVKIEALVSGEEIPLILAETLPPSPETSAEKKSARKKSAAGAALKTKKSESKELKEKKSGHKNKAELKSEKKSAATRAAAAKTSSRKSAPGETGAGKKSAKTSKKEQARRASS